MRNALSPVGNENNNGLEVQVMGKCRYKTGKCSNSRSFKRNGQYHQLCQFHREKANRIQRKFDRQKRSQARSTKTTVKSPQSMELFPYGSNTPQDMEFFSDSDSACRSSTDSTSSESSQALEDLWNETPVNHPPQSYPATFSHEPVPVNSTEYMNVDGHLSVDELDFLYSAVIG